MNVRKAVKRIAALAAGTTMVTATMMGAMAYDLGDYPEPFVKNGLFGGKLVIGKDAQVSDVLGAIDIAASLQAAAKTEVSADGVSSSVSVTGGVALASGSDDLIIGDDIDAPNTGSYDDADFPDLLADGIVEDDDGTEYDYTQEIIVPDAQVVLERDDTYGEDPILAVNVKDAADQHIYFVVDFQDALNVEDLDDSETIELFGM